MKKISHLRQFDEEFLKSLIGESREQRDLDFKGVKILDKSSKKNVAEELCKDIAAFANTDGGLIILGMEEAQGTATELTGFDPFIDLEQQVQSWELSISKGIDPGIIGLHFHIVDLVSSGNKAVVIEIPRSYAQPHMVRASQMIYIRRSGHNDPMRISELRHAFNLSETYIQNVRKFRSERLKSLAGDSPTPTDIPIPIILKTDGVFLALHVIPFSFSESLIDLEALRSVPLPIVDGGHFNLDGYVRIFTQNDYVQFYRNGVVEYVTWIGEYSGSNKEAVIDIIDFENKALSELHEVLSVQEYLGEFTPQLVALTLINRTTSPERIARFDLRQHHPPQHDTSIRRRVIALPETIDHGGDPVLDRIAPLFQPAFDMLWNSAGEVRSISYDKEGRWNRSRPF